MAYIQPSSGPFKMMGSSPMKEGKTKFWDKVKSAWYTGAHHDGSKSSIQEQYKTYKGKKKEYRDAEKTGKKVDFISGF
jgi:hypothetical protein